MKKLEEAIKHLKFHTNVVAIKKVTYEFNAFKQRLENIRKWYGTRFHIEGQIAFDWLMDWLLGKETKQEECKHVNAMWNPIMGRYECPDCGVMWTATAKSGYQINRLKPTLTDPKIRKVKVLQGRAKERAEKMGLNPDDLVIVTPEGHIEKITGDPVSYLLKRDRTTRRYDGEIDPRQHAEEIDECLKISKELKRTLETDGTYCPYNWAFPYQAKVVHELLDFLHKKVTCRTQRV